MSAQISKKGPKTRIAKTFMDRTVVPFVLYVMGKALLHPRLNYQENIRREIEVLRRDLLAREIEQLRRDVARKTPGNPCADGFKVYAQTDEDGILESIFDQIPGGNKTFIEIGCGRGLENNTHYLLLKGYRGCWVDGSRDNVEFINNELGGLEFSPRLLVRHDFISVECAREVMESLIEFLKTTKLDLFSIDIDGNDLPVLKECLKYCSPRVICAEYNPKFPPPLSVSMPYAADHTWAGDDYHGASLGALCDLLQDYQLVACNLTGANAFFVRRDLSKPFPEYSPKELYQPFREKLILLRAEHTPSLKWLRANLHAD